MDMFKIRKTVDDYQYLVLINSKISLFCKEVELI